LAQKLGQYTLEEKIGEGGMGQVYRAKHAMLRRPTAVKFLSPDKMTDETIGRFEREVQLTSQLSHPNTIAIYDFGRTEEGIFYYSMEYLKGINLQTLVERDGPVSENRVIYILKQVCESLAEAHCIGLIHRDIKPANIFLCQRGLKYDFVKVLDFGLVKSLQKKNETQFTRVGVIAGTPAYMAPEMAQDNSEVDARTDIYALGCIGYWLMSGQLVFKGKDTVATIIDHLKTKPVPPSKRSELHISRAMDDVIMNCLEKDPNRRSQSAKELYQLLDNCQEEEVWSVTKAEQWWQMRGID